MDLFEDHKNLPDNVKNLINQFNIDKETTSNIYMLCSKLDEDLDALGYIFEYGLDAEPFNLQKK